MYTKSSSSVIESTYASSSFFSTACSLCTTSRTKSSGSGTGRTLPPTHVESKCFPPPSSSSSTPSNEGVRRIIRRTVMRTNCALQHRFPVQHRFPFSGATSKKLQQFSCKHVFRCNTNTAAVFRLGVRYQTLLARVPMIMIMIIMIMMIQVCVECLIGKQKSWSLSDLTLPFKPASMPVIVTVLSETKPYRHIPVWARYSPLRPGTRDKAHLMMLSP